MELIGFYIYHVAFARYLIILFGRIELDLEHLMVHILLSHNDHLQSIIIIYIHL